MEHWNWPQYTMIIIWGLHLLMGAALHDKPKTGKYSIISAIIGTALSVWILSSGGFFK